MNAKEMVEKIMKGLGGSALTMMPKLKKRKVQVVTSDGPLLPIIDVRVTDDKIIIELEEPEVD